MTIKTLIGAGLVGLGVFLTCVAAIGLVRLPDVYNRANAVTKAAGLGVVAVLSGVAVLSASPSTVALLVLAALVQLFTVPVSGYAIGEAAWTSRAPLIPSTHRDKAGKKERADAYDDTTRTRRQRPPSQ